MHAQRWVIQGSAAVAALAFALAVWALFLQHQLTYTEGYMLEQAVRLADGGGLYQDPETKPWIVDNFPPLWIAVLAGGVELFGVQFAFGRLLTMAATAALGVMLWSFQRRRGDPNWLAVGMVAFWLLSPFMLRRMLMVRMDLPALAFMAAGMLCIVAFRQRRWGLPAAALAFLAAVMSRQTALIAPAAGVLGLWMSGERRRALILASWFAVLLVAAVAWLQVWTDGRFFTHVVVHNTGRWDLSKAVRTAGGFLASHLLLVLFGAVGAWRQWRGGPDARILVTWCAMEGAVLATIGKPGTAGNHFLPLIFVLALHAGPGIRFIVDRLRARRPSFSWDQARGVAVVLAVQAIVMAVPLGAGAAKLLDEQEDEADLVRFLEGEPGPVLGENAGALLQSGHEVLLEPRTTLEQNLAGRWNDSSLVSNVEQQGFTLIVTETFPEYARGHEGMRFTQATWQAIQEHYERTERVGRWQVWRPAS